MAQPIGKDEYLVKIVFRSHSLFSISSGKTKSVNVLCTILNRNCVVDTIDDSVTGSFQQVDLYRHLEDVAKNIESILIVKLQELAFASSPQNFAKFLQLLDLWESYVISLENAEGELYLLFVDVSNFSVNMWRN